MKILLDECVTKKLRNYLSDFEVYTVVKMGWNGLRNGNLMSEAVDNEFDILLTIDKNLSYQQNLKKFDIVVVVLDAQTSSINDIAPLIPSFLDQLDMFQKGSAYIIKD